MRKFITCCWLIYLSLYFVNIAMAQPIFSEEKLLYSSMNGKEMAKLKFNIEPKTNGKPNEYVLIITNKQDNTNIWIFSEEIKADNLKSLHLNMEAKGIKTILPFCNGNKVKISSHRSENITNQIKIPLTTTVLQGETVNMSLNFYFSSKAKKKIIIDNHAETHIAFTLPPSQKKMENIVAATPEKDPVFTTLTPDTDLSSSIERTPEELEALQQRKSDSLLQIKMSDLDLFISGKNTEIETLLAEINKLEEEGQKSESNFIDFIEQKANILREEVDVCKDNAILSKNENLRKKFTDFSSKYTEILKKIHILRQEPVKTNWWMYIGIASGILMLAGMLFMQIWNQIKIKRQQRRQQAEIEKEMRRNAFDGFDQNIESI